MSIETETLARIVLVDPFKRGSLSLCEHIGTATSGGKKYDVSLSGMTVIVANQGRSGGAIHHAEIPLRRLIEAAIDGLIEHADKITDATTREDNGQKEADAPAEG